MAEQSIATSKLIRIWMRSKRPPLDTLQLIQGLNKIFWVTEHGMNTLMHTAAKYNNHDVIRALVREGHPVETYNTYRLTPLHWAIQFDGLDAAKVLLECGHPVDCVNDEGMTPLHLAIIKLNFKAVELLLEFGANAFRKMNETVTCYSLIENMKMTEPLSSRPILESVEDLFSKYENATIFLQDIFS